MRGLAIAVLLEEEVRDVLVAHRRGRPPATGRARAPARALSRDAREDLLVEVGERHDEPHVVLGDERRERRDVAAGRRRAARAPCSIGVVERRRESVGVGRDRGRAGTAERGDDVDALAGAGEEHGGHGGREYRQPGRRSGVLPAAGARRGTCRRRARAACAAGSSGRRAASGARRTRRRARSARPTAAWRGRGSAPSPSDPVARRAAGAAAPCTSRPGSAASAAGRSGSCRRGRRSRAAAARRPTSGAGCARRA